jgi:hypothetical protein
MAVSEVSICNGALDLLGSDPIASFDDGSKAANLCSRRYSVVRDACLRAYPWNCAIRRTGLAADTTAPAWGYANRFALPEGPDPEFCLRVLRLEGEDVGATYKVEGRFILSDEGAPLNILYLARIGDPAQFDALLVEAISARLAADLAWPLTGSQSAAVAMRDTYRAKLIEARSIDAQEGSVDELSANAWLDSRM